MKYQNVIEQADIAVDALRKAAFQTMPPMPAGAPPMDPAMMGGAPPMDPAMMGGGGMPMDPAMAGGGMPMDPAMMGGAPPMDPAMMGGAPPMDPSMMGGAPPAEAGTDQIIGLIEEMSAVLQESQSRVETLEAQVGEMAEVVATISEAVGVGAKAG